MAFHHLSIPALYRKSPASLQDSHLVTENTTEQFNERGQNINPTLTTQAPLSSHARLLKHLLLVLQPAIEPSSFLQGRWEKMGSCAQAESRQQQRICLRMRA